MNIDVEKSNIVCTFNWQQIFRDNEKSRISKFQLITLRRRQRPLPSRAQPHTSSVYCWLAATMVLVLRGTFERRPRNDRRTSDRRQFPSAPHSPPQDNILNKAGFGRSCLRLDNNNGNFGWRFSLWLDIEPQGDTFVHRMLSSSLAVKKCWFAPLKHMIINWPLQNCNALLQSCNCCWSFAVTAPLKFPWQEKQAVSDSSC